MRQDLARFPPGVSGVGVLTERWHVGEIGQAAGWFPLLVQGVALSARRRQVK